MLEVLIGVNGREIGRLKIVNDATGTNESANYIVHHEGGSFTIRGHNREYGAWVLSERAIHKYLTGEDTATTDENATSGGRG